MSTVAVLDPGPGPAAHHAAELVRALANAGGRPLLVSATGAPPDGVPALRYRAIPERVLQLRKLGDGLGRLPGAALALRRARPDVIHAFSYADALAAALSQTAPVVLTVCRVPRREELAARRLRLATVVRALAASEAVVAVDPAVRDGLRRWLAVEADVIAPAPPALAAEAYARVYVRASRRRVG